MFWHLLFAHFLADYPLQSNWIAANKDKFPVLATHAVIHLAVMLAVSGSARSVIWPFLLALAAIHLSIDALKIRVAHLKPDWVVLPYLADQGLHYLTLAGMTWWISERYGSQLMLFDARFAIIGTGLLLATYVSFISERVLYKHNPAYVKEVIQQRWSRCLARAFLWGGLVWLISPQTGLAIALVILPGWPYSSGRFARRALLTDLFVVLLAFLWVQWAFRIV